jgi:hypothetical protein
MGKTFSYAYKVVTIKDNYGSNAAIYLARNGRRSFNALLERNPQLVPFFPQYIEGTTVSINLPDAYKDRGIFCFRTVEDCVKFRRTYGISDSTKIVKVKGFDEQSSIMFSSEAGSIPTSLLYGVRSRYYISSQSLKEKGWRIFSRVKVIKQVVLSQEFNHDKNSDR